MRAPRPGRSRFTPRVRPLDCPGQDPARDPPLPNPEADPRPLSGIVDRLQPCPDLWSGRTHPCGTHPDPTPTCGPAPTPGSGLSLPRPIYGPAPPRPRPAPRPALPKSPPPPRPKFPSRPHRYSPRPTPAPGTLIGCFLGSDWSAPSPFRHSIGPRRPLSRCPAP